MITTRFYLDCRAVIRGQAAPLRLVITKSSVRAYVPLSVNLLPSQWDSRRQIVIGHPRKVAINNHIQSQKLAVDKIIFRLCEDGSVRGRSAGEIKQLVMGELYPSEDPRATPPATPYSCLLSYIEEKSGRTRELYEITKDRLLAYCPGFPSLRFEDITPAWLSAFDADMAKTSPSRNARNIHLRNIRAVFNSAIDDGLTSCYPFRKFKLIYTPTLKRSLTIEQLRAFFHLAVDRSERRYIDFARLSFLLCGINCVDLCAAPPAVNGRLEYRRAKTHRLYSVKLEPEALALIEKYRGSTGLVNFAEGCKSYRSFYKHLADTLRDKSSRLGVSGFSSYWLRHSWATVAAYLEIPKETIAAALGHGGNTVTDIYINFDQSKVDAANRRVLDWVLYGKM